MNEVQALINSVARLSIIREQLEAEILRLNQKLEKRDGKTPAGSSEAEPPAADEHSEGTRNAAD